MLDGRGNTRLRACQLGRDLAGRSCVTRLSSRYWRGRHGTWDGRERWGRNLRDGRGDRGLLRQQSITSPPDGRGSDCDENNGDCRDPHRRKRATFSAPLQLALERPGALESRCFTLESAQVLELSTAGHAEIQMSVAIIQPRGGDPAIDVGFQVLMGKVSDGLSNTAEFRGPLGLQLRIRFWMIQHLCSASGRLQWCRASMRRQRDGVWALWVADAVTSLVVLRPGASQVGISLLRLRREAVDPSRRALCKPPASAALSCATAFATQPTDFRQTRCVTRWRPGRPAPEPQDRLSNTNFANCFT
jgi:hypothetical protein